MTCVHRSNLNPTGRLHIAPQGEWLTDFLTAVGGQAAELNPQGLSNLLQAAAVLKLKVPQATLLQLLR